jgi:carbon monoxide dehydrogenase subunit G
VTVQLDHEFTVPVPADRAWPVLLDVERIGPCMPGATITKVDGRDFEGKVKVKVGPITVTYAGQASFLEVDDEQRRAVISAKGKEARGSGTANATITAQLHEEGDTTRVTVRTDLAITGRPAQFGRGVMVDVGGKLLGRFADCLATQLTAEPEAAAAETPAAEPKTAAEAVTPAVEALGVDAPAAEGSAPQPVPAEEPATNGAAPTTSGAANGSAPRNATPRPAYPPQDEAIDLLEAAGGPVLKRLAPVLGALLLLALLVAALRRRGR